MNKIRIPKLIKKRSQKVGLPPGTLIHIGEKKIEEVKITEINYDQFQFQEKKVKNIEDCFPIKEKPTITWINIDGIHQLDVIENFGKFLDLNPLILEDILNTEQRPKMDNYEKYIYIVLNMLYYDDKIGEIHKEQVSLVLGLNYVISFQESEGDVFNPIRDRIRNDKGRIRKMGSDYLAYALLDSIVDNYFSVLEKLGEKIEDLEEELITNPTQETIRSLHKLKREMLFLRRSVWPLRELINNLQKVESLLIKKTIVLYLRDLYDHAIQIIDTAESLRDILSSMIDIYLSSLSNKMNEVMKVLTIIATIFIPLTLVSGIYGMNFKYMPELDWVWGYPLTLVIMLLIGMSLLLYFRKRKWI